MRLRQCEGVVGGVWVDWDTICKQRVQINCSFSCWCRCNDFSDFSLVLLFLHTIRTNASPLSVYAWVCPSPTSLINCCCRPGETRNEKQKDVKMKTKAKSEKRKTKKKNNTRNELKIKRMKIQTQMEHRKIDKKLNSICWGSKSDACNAKRERLMRPKITERSSRKEVLLDSCLYLSSYRIYRSSVPLLSFRRRSGVVSAVIG